MLRRLIWLLIFAYVLFCLGTFLLIFVSMAVNFESPLLDTERLTVATTIEIVLGVIGWRVCRWTGLADQIAWPSRTFSRDK